MKIDLDGSIIDIGSRDSSNNILRYNKNVKNIKFADKYANNEKIIKIDLEEFPNHIQENFQNVFLINVLEHIKNYENCLRNAYQLTAKGGKFFGSTPFLFRYHPSPNDYFRYTNQLILEKLSEVGFRDVKVNVIMGGIFLSFYSNIFIFTNKIPLSFIINIPIFLSCIFFDKILSFLVTNYKSSYPIGYFFYGKK